MTAPTLPLTDTEIARALAPGAGRGAPAGLADRIAAEVRATSRQPGAIALPARLRPTYPDQRSRWAILLAAALLAVALLAAAVAASRFVSQTLPHGNGVINLSFRGGYLEVGPDGTGAALRSFPGLTNPAAAWSPRGDVVAFWGTPGRGSLLIFQSADGSVVDRIDPSTQPGIPLMAPGGLVWSPNGRSLVVEGAIRGTNHLFRIDLPDRHFVDISPEGIAAIEPSWSSRDEIAFLSGDTTRWTGVPWVMTATGKAAEPILRTPPDGYVADASVFPPAWSPDGGRLLFSASLLGDGRAYVVNRDGTGLTRIGATLPSVFNPIWSPDGLAILFESWANAPDDEADLYLADADGRNERLVGRNAQALGFSPDGTTILAASPACNSFDRSGNLCDQSVTWIDRSTGATRTFLASNEIDRLGPTTEHDGIGGVFWRAVFR